ncbi:MAG: response regulator transcription factor [Pseudomonadota bacterium]
MTNPAKPQRDTILVVEDDAEMAQALLSACEELGFATEHLTTCAEALAAAEAGTYPLAILDRMLPDGDSVDLLARLRAEGSVQGILMVSALAHAGHRTHGLDRGADDYLAKPFSPEELRARIRALMRRATAAQGEHDYLVFEGLEVRVKARTVHYEQAHIPISPKEFELLLYFARHAGAPLSRMQLLENVWNLHFDPQTNVVDVHVGRLRRKLETQTGRPWIHTERGAGYWFGPAETIEEP